MARKSRRIVAKVLDKWGKKLIKETRRYMTSKNKVASGETYRSLSYRVFREGDNPSLEITSDKYLRGIDEGQPPQKQGKSYPSDSFVKNIEDWMRAKGIQPRSERSGRFVKRSVNSYKRNARRLAIAIIRRGTIKRFNYGGIGIKDHLMRTQIGKMVDDVADAYTIQFREEIQILADEINKNNMK